MIDIVNSVVDNFNKFLIKCFERCGFSEEYVMSNIDQFSIRCQQLSLHDWYNTYKHGNKPLFSIHQFLDYGSCSVKCDVIFHEEKNRPSVLTNAGEIKLEERTVI